MAHMKRLMRFIVGLSSFSYNDANITLLSTSINPLIAEKTAYLIGNNNSTNAKVASRLNWVKSTELVINRAFATISL